MKVEGHWTPYWGNRWLAPRMPVVTCRPVTVTCAPPVILSAAQFPPAPLFWPS